MCVYLHIYYSLMMFALPKTPSNRHSGYRGQLSLIFIEKSSKMSRWRRQRSIKGCCWWGGAFSQSPGAFKHMDPFSRFLSTVVLLACGREDVPACLGPCDSVGRRCDTADQLLVMIHQEAEWEREAHQHTTQLGALRIPQGACQDPGGTPII